MRQIHCKELKVSRPPLVTKFVTRYARVSLLPLIAAGVGLGLGLGRAGCKPKTCAAGAGFTMPPGGMPVQTQTADETAVPMTDTYVATIKSRRSATINPQVTGNLISIAVHSGEHVNKGQVLMEIDPFKQRAMVDSTAATEQQKLAVYQYNQSEVERQRKLFEGGITSRDAYDQALQSFRNAKADYESSVASTGTQKQELAYYRIVAPFAGMVGDVPVHIGDYVAASTLLTTVDADTDLEAYVYVPTDKAGELHMGLPVSIVGPDDKALETSKVDFLSPQVDNGLQGILVKAPVHSSTADKLRNQQLVKARVTWSDKQMVTIPVLAVTRLGGQSFVYIAQPAGPGKYVAHQVPVELGDTVGNSYAVESGIAAGEKVILSGVQMLAEGEPVHPLS
jgi:RND family efflux transporter MFP subunit